MKLAAQQGDVNGMFDFGAMYTCTMKVKVLSGRTKEHLNITNNKLQIWDLLVDNTCTRWVSCTQRVTVLKGTGQGQSNCGQHQRLKDLRLLSRISKKLQKKMKNQMKKNMTKNTTKRMKYQNKQNIKKYYRIPQLL